jgi:acetyl esterase/lipase
VPVENSLMFVEALRKAKIPFEIHIFEHGEHGYGLATGLSILSSWPLRCADWFRTRKFIR